MFVLLPGAELNRPRATRSGNLLLIAFAHLAFGGGCEFSDGKPTNFLIAIYKRIRFHTVLRFVVQIVAYCRYRSGESGHCAANFVTQFNSVFIVLVSFVPFGGLFFNQFGVIVDIADEKSETRIKTTHIGVICVEFFQ